MIYRSYTSVKHLNSFFCGNTSNDPPPPRVGQKGISDLYRLKPHTPMPLSVTFPKPQTLPQPQHTPISNKCCCIKVDNTSYDIQGYL